MKIIPVLFTTNNNGIPHYEVVASSICNTLDPEYKIKIYCIYEHGSPDIWRIERLKKIYSNIHSVKLIDYEETFGEVTLPKKQQWPNAIYYSLVAEHVIKENKYVFLDDDTLILQSLDKLYNIDLGNNAWAGTVQLNAVSATSDYLGEVISRIHPDMEYKPEVYINKGISVINNKLWKKENACDKLQRLIRGNKLAFPEQDAMNVLFYGRIINLDPKYGFFNSSFYTTVYLDEDKKATLYALGREYCNQMKECILKPEETIIAIHYAGGKCKPWNNTKTAMADVYLKAMGKFVSQVKEKGFSLIEP